jgi:glycosyltransferase involved in cell wall biosynthesis
MIVCWLITLSRPLRRHPLRLPIRQSESMSQAPAVSVCLPVYNGERYLKVAIDSVLSQTFKDFELLIIDDCSTDDSPNIIADYQSRDGRIKVVKNSHNLGLFNNYNECIKQACGRFIKLFAQDDVFHPTILERMVEVLATRDNVALVTCAKGWISETGEVVVVEAANENALRTLRPFTEDTCKPAHEAILDSFYRFVNWLGEPCTVMFRQEHKGSGFDTRFKQIGDLEYSYRLLQHGDYYFLSDTLCQFRKHDASTTNRNGRSLSALLDWFVLGSKYKHLIAELNETETEFCERLTRRLVKTIATRFAAYTENTKIDPTKVLEQLTDYETVLSCFATAAGTKRNEEEEYKMLAVCALKEGANLANEVRYAQNRAEFQEQQLADLRSELEEVRAALLNEVSELRQALSQVGTSLSWKITAPLRTFKGIMR